MDCKEPHCLMSRRTMLRRLAAGATGGLIVWVFPGLASGKELSRGAKRPAYAYAVDISRCIGCCTCMRACRAENDVPEGNFRTWVERYRVSADGNVHVDVASKDNFVFQETPAAGTVKAFFVPKLCNHCEKSVCSQVCPVGAAYTAPEGAVLVDRQRCIGCGYCVQACPYGTRFISPVTHTADKCTFCYHRITRGLPPACVLSCPKSARIYGDLNDPASRLSTLLKQRRFRVLKPEMGTHPKCYYIDLDIEVI